MNTVCVLFDSCLVNKEIIKRFRHIQAGCRSVGYDQVCWFEDHNVLCPGFTFAPKRPAAICENKVWYAIKADYIWPYHV